MIEKMSKKLGFGCMRLPVLEGNAEKIDDETFSKMVDTYIEQGFAYFDTAFPYHNQKSEEAVKRCLVQRYDRDKFYLADKMPCWMVKEPSDLQKVFDIQLERCGVAYFDFYLLHAMNKERVKEMEEKGGFAFIRKMKEEGKIRHIGFSFHDSAAVLEETLNNHPEVEFVQLQINYYDWDSENVQSKKCYEVATAHDIPVIVMEPVKGGTLANMIKKPAEIFAGLDSKASFASFAVRYAASLENVLVVLSGMSDYDQLVDNTSYMKDFQPLSEKEQQAIAEVVAELEKIPTIECTKCRYCVEGCPKKIQIPDFFAEYNTLQQFGAIEAAKRNFPYITGDGHGKPSECIKCGKCEEQCPQHLPIRELLGEVAELLED